VFFIQEHMRLKGICILNDIIFRHGIRSHNHLGFKNNQVMLQIPFVSILSLSKNDMAIKITIELMINYYWILIKL
jgi:hypothetical protein